MRKLVFILSVLFLAAGATDVQAQWLKKLGKKAEEAAKRAVERNVEKKVDNAVDDAFDKSEDAVKGKNKDKTTETDNAANTNANGQAVQDGSQQPPQQSLEMVYAKSDFVAGDEIIFEDLMDNEQLGEFPSMWDLKEGSAEVAMINGKKAIYRSDKEEGTYTVAPLMKDPNTYLPEKYTIEMDLWMAVYNQGEENAGPVRYSYEMYFYSVEDGNVASVEINNHNFGGYMEWDYISTSDAGISGNSPLTVTSDGWHHLAISFNKRAFKIYLDGIRVANIPNMKQAASFALRDANINRYSWASAITNVRIAQGAVPLYDRMMTDGKFITYGITFDVGKSTIKPESMGEINRIVKLMTENPDLKFSVEGHTDSTGNAASNQTLSESRSKAIVDKLTELGIAATRLTATGKGQTTPIADNGTDEGRAKNRRVEFVKM